MTEALLGFTEDESEPMRDVPDKIITKTTFEVRLLFNCLLNLIKFRKLMLSSFQLGHIALRLHNPCLQVLVFHDM